MTATSKLRTLARNAVSVAVHFAHGSLLVAGILAAVFIAGRIAAIEAPDAGAQAVRGLIGEPQLVRAAAASGEDARETAPELRSVVGYLSRKYRVAAPAVEPLVDAARASGERLGLDPMLIVAVMAIESGFNPIAESPMGAQGLMQVIPRFHQDKLKEADGPDALLDPLINIHVGTRVLKEYIRATGSLQAGLQQYAGAVRDGEAQYAAKVLAEKQRLDAVLRRGREQTGA